MLELTADELTRVVGAEISGLPCDPTNPSDHEVCASIFEPCITWGLCTTR